MSLFDTFAPIVKKALLREEMARGASLSVPLKADANIGHTWAQCHWESR